MIIRAPCLCLSACLLAVAPAQAQSANANAEVAVVTPLSLVKTADLQFGNIATTILPGTVTVAPTGLRTAGGGAVLAGGTVSAAEFTGLGERNHFVTFTFGALTVPLTRISGTETMLVTGFAHGASSATGLAFAGPRWRISNATGIFTIPVGATLIVGPNQAGGVYTGSFSLTVNYQ